MTLLEISDLSIRFETHSGTVRAVDSVDLSLDTGDRIALIGESGCGKTVIGLSVMRLLPSNATISGSIRYAGRDLLRADEREMQCIRGKDIAMVSQNSLLALNPLMKIGDQVMEVLALHTPVRDEALRRETINLLENLGIEDPDQNMQKYPHQFSGGMRERILIAMALACKPDIIIADEPTSGIDALVKLQILHLLKTVIQDRTLLLITHDLGTASFLTDHIAVLYAGEIVEYGPTRDVFSKPLHPYTRGLLASLPTAGFQPIHGMSPSPGNIPAGCRFSPRCTYATARCSEIHPVLKKTCNEWQVRCFHYD